MSKKVKTATDILEEMAATHRQRNVIYKDNNKLVGAVMVAMFPEGVVLKSANDFNRWHNFELIVIKLTRFANSGLLHKDSIRDAGVYAAIVESFTNKNSKPIKGNRP